MILKILNWFFSPTKKQIVEEHGDFYTKLLELENRIEELERENVETTNAIYEIANSLEARIDIIASEPYKLPLDTNN
jgi:hypothetical protein